MGFHWRQLLFEFRIKWDNNNKYEYIDLHTLTQLLTELSPSREAANSAATQEVPSILWNPKIHYRVHKSPPLVPIQIQINPIHTIPSHLSKIHFNIVYSPTSWFSQWSSYVHFFGNFECKPLNVNLDEEIEQIFKQK
jgi:hypothetical protein